MEKENTNFPMFVMPTVLPQMFVPNIHPFYLHPQNIELFRMMHAMYNGNNQNLGAMAFQQHLETSNQAVSNPKSKPLDLNETDLIRPSGETSLYNTEDIPLIPSTVTTVDVTLEFAKLALSGCDLGERIALSHQKRPCFKKIDSLCARLKQDLIRVDGVLANINSQGVAWAVKDFIFVFTRIINAWIIIKGYANNSSEGLSKVRSALSPNFIEAFQKWQDSTKDFVDEIIKSFVNLDGLVQSQRSGVFSKNDFSANRSSEETNNDKSDIFEDSYSSNSSVHLSETADMEMKLNFSSTILVNSEEVQVKHLENGTYFKTGVYNPLRKHAKNSVQDPDILKGKHFLPSSSSSPIKTDAKRKPNKNENKNHSPDVKQIQPMEHINLRAIWNPLKIPVNTEMTKWNSYFLSKIQDLKGVEYIFHKQFMENYFPDFFEHIPNYVDLRSIILNLEASAYTDVYEIVHDLRQIVYSAKKYLKIKSNTLLKISLNSFEKELENILSDEIFAEMNFEKITGAPKDENL